MVDKGLFAIEACRCPKVHGCFASRATELSWKQSLWLGGLIRVIVMGLRNRDATDPPDSRLSAYQSLCRSMRQEHRCEDDGGENVNIRHIENAVAREHADWLGVDEVHDRKWRERKGQEISECSGTG